MMQTAVGLLIYLALVASLGLAVTSDRIGSVLSIRRVYASIFAGTFLLSLLSLVMSMMGTLPSIAFYVILLLAIVITRIKKYKGELSTLSPCTLCKDLKSCRLAYIPIIAIAILLAYALFCHINMTFYYWDAWTIWGIKAKLMATHPLSDVHVYSQVKHSFSHLTYPPLLTSHYAIVMTLCGSVDTSCSTIVVPLLLVGLVLCLYDIARLVMPRFLALCITAAFMWTPYIVESMTVSSGDMAVAACYACVIACILRWQHSGEEAFAVPFCLSGAALMSAKNEGLPLFVLALITLVLIMVMKKRTSWPMIAASFMAVVPMVPWWLYARQLPKTDENYSAHLNLSTLMDRLDQFVPVLKACIPRFVDPGHWGAFLVLAVVAVCTCRAHRRLQTIFIVQFILHAAVYVVIYMVTPWDSAENIVNASFVRICLHLYPLLFTIAVLGLATSTGIKAQHTRNKDLTHSDPH